MSVRLSECLSWMVGLLQLMYTLSLCTPLEVAQAYIYSGAIYIEFLTTINIYCTGYCWRLLVQRLTWHS